MALAEPATYFKLRDQVYQSIVETNVEVSYNLYWDILTKGQVNGTQISVLNKDGEEFDFEPNLPESEVNTFALEVAEAVKDIAERAVERVMPMEYKDLAVRRAKEIFSKCLNHYIHQLIFFYLIIFIYSKLNKYDCME